MTKRTVPTHPQGWKFCGADGAFRVWHAGKNDYRVTSPDGDVIAYCEQLSPAFRFASCQHSLNSYYTDRANSGQATLTAHR